MRLATQATSGDRGPTIVLEEGHFPHATMADLHANLTALEVSDRSVCI
jgi:hypothetical protein